MPIDLNLTEMSSYAHLQQRQPATPRNPDHISLLSHTRSSSPTLFSSHDTLYKKVPLTTSSSRYSTPPLPQIPGWPSQPQNLRKKTSEIWLNIAIETFLVVISLPLLALAIAVVYYSDKVVVDSEWDVFKQIINSVGTAFPYVFGIVVGRAMKLFGAWRLERGVSIGILEQIMGSSTLGSTLTTHTLLRPFNWATLGLFTLWIFSPMGSRVSLGLIEPKYQPVISHTSIRYLDTTQASKFYSKAPEDQVEIIAGPINALYASSLMAPETSKKSSVDQWGNIKIPYLDRLGTNLTSNSTGWISLSGLQPSAITYSSLLGIPFSKAKDIKPTNTTWKMTTTYLSLNCHTMTREPLIPLDTDLYNTTWHSLSTSPSILFSLAMNGFISPNKTLESSHSISSFVSATNASSIPHTLLFQSPIWKDDVSLNATANLIMAPAYCDLAQQYVDVEVRCLGTQNCAVAAMRESLVPHAPKQFTVLGFDFGFKMLSYLLPLATGESVTGGALPQSTATELYLSGISATLSHLTKVDLSLLTPEEMEIRLGQVLNTYYMASLSPYSLAGNFSAGNALEILVPASSTTLSNRYSINKKWLAMYFISCSVLLIAVICGIVLKTLVVAPDILGWVSSLTRDNPYVGARVGGSAMAGWRRARILKSIRVRIGDVGEKREEGVGYIAVAREEDIQRLDRERFYL